MKTERVNRHCTWQSRPKPMCAFTALIPTSYLPPIILENCVQHLILVILNTYICIQIYIYVCVCRHGGARH